jgi:hypothetical protein
VTVGLLALVFLLGQQGARLGSWLPPRSVPGWVWPLLALAVACLPRGSRPQRAAPLLGGALALALLAWPLFAWRREVACPPLALTAFVGSLSQPEAPATRTVVPDFGRLRRAPPWHRLVGRHQDFVLEIEGWLWAPRTTTYRFELRADDAATLSIDGVTVVPPASQAAVNVPLTSGRHAITLRHQQGVGAAYLMLDWDRPPLIELIPLEGYLAGWPEAAEPAAWRRRHRTTLVSLALAWIWWLGAGLVLAGLGEARHGWPAVARPEARARAWARARWGEPDVRRTVWVFASAAVFVFGLEAAFRSRAIGGLYFQSYTSEYLMQTVSVADLRDEPWRSLFYLHIQPPALDALRALIAHLTPRAPDALLLRRVDTGLYVAWGLVYAGLMALVCAWLSALTTRRFALLGTALLALHPAVLFYATLLDSTLLSAALLLWFCFELWRWSAGDGSVGRLAASMLALFFTRSVFQWPFLLVVAASLLLLRVPWRKAARALGVVALVMAVYLGKQYWLFGVTLTSTFAGDSFCKGIAAYCQGTTPVALPELPSPQRARVLSRTAKIGGDYNYNQIAFLRRSFSQMVEYRALLRRQPLRTTLVTWGGNLGLYLRPSSRYSTHTIVDSLPWREPYDAVLSGWALALLVAGGGLLALLQNGPRRTLALSLPVLYVFAVTVIFEGGENMRYKFFVEPTICVFLIAQAYRAGKALRSLPGGAAAVVEHGRSELR